MNDTVEKTRNTLKENAVKSALWSFVERFSLQGFSFVIGLILARLLTPDDYGVIAILNVFIVISTVFIDGGFSNALIQKQDRTHEDYSTVFYTNIGIALCCYIFLFFTAPLWAAFFDQSSLAPVMRVYGLTLILSALSAVQKVRFYVCFDFRTVAVLSLISIVIAGAVAVKMAFDGYGVWALVAYHILSSCINSAGLWIKGRWHPALVFSSDSFRRTFGFGSKLLGANLLNVITSNLYTFCVGKFFSVTSLGYYNRGQSIAYIVPSNFANIAGQASYPVLCELQTDKERLRNYFGKYVRLSFMVTAPLMTLLAVLAEPLVVLLLTDKWLPSVFFIRILAIGYALDPVLRLNANVINVTGRSSYSLYAEFWKKLSLIAILVFTSFLGLKAMTIGLACYSIVDLAIVSRYTNRITGVDLMEQSRMLLPFIFYCLGSGTIVALIIGAVENTWARLFIGGSAGVAAYSLLLFLFSRKSLTEAWRILKAWRS